MLCTPRLPARNNAWNFWEAAFILLPYITIVYYRKRGSAFRFSLHTSRLTLLKWSPLWRWNSRWVLTFRCQKNSPSLFRFFQVVQLFFSSKKMNQINTKTIGSRKRDCAWGCARGINTTWENLQITQHKSGRAYVSLTGLICALRSADFLGWCYPPSATSRTISFSIPKSFGIDIM